MDRVRTGKGPEEGGSVSLKRKEIANCSPWNPRAAQRLLDCVRSHRLDAQALEAQELDRQRYRRRHTPPDMGIEGHSLMSIHAENNIRPDEAGGPNEETEGRFDLPRRLSAARCADWEAASEKQTSLCLTHNAGSYQTSYLS